MGAATIFGGRAIDVRRVLAFVVAAACVVAGIVMSDGRHQTAVLLLFVAGGAVLAWATVLYRSTLQLRELEIGIGVVKAKLGADRVEVRASVALETGALLRFAWLMCGDEHEARNGVEDTLAEARRVGRRLSASARNALELRTLLDRLETSANRRWLRGTSPDPHPRAGQPAIADEDRRTIGALASLEFPARAVFLLRNYWPLTVDEVAFVVGRAREQVAAEIAAATKQVEQFKAASVDA